MPSGPADKGPSGGSRGKAEHKNQLWPANSLSFGCLLVHLGSERQNTSAPELARKSGKEDGSGHERLRKVDEDGDREENERSTTGRGKE